MCATGRRRAGQRAGRRAWGSRAWELEREPGHVSLAIRGEMGWGCRRGRARVFVPGRTEAPSHIVLFAQDPCRHVCRAGAYGGEAESPSGIFLEGDSSWRDLVYRAGNLIDRGSEVAIVHADDRFTRLFDALQDLLVFDLEFSVVLGLGSHLLPVGVVLP